jgi:serine/threonine-protein kinase
VRRDGPAGADPGAAAGHGATEIYEPAGPGGGARAGDTAVYQHGDLEAAPPSNRKLFVQLGVALAAIVAVTVGMVMWAGARREPVAVTTPSATPTTFAPSQTPTQTPEPVTESPTGDPSPGVVATILPDLDQSGESAPPKATLGPQVPPGGWGTWLERFDEAVSLQENSGGINPEVAAKVREKIQNAARKFDEGRQGATLDQIAGLYRDLRRAQQQGDMESSGPLAEFMNEWRISDR